MRHKATRDLFDYWRLAKGARATPERDDIDPALMRHLLADTFLVETGPDGGFRIRLSGTRIDALWLADLTGRDFPAMWGEDSGAVTAALWTAMDGATPLVVGARLAPRGRVPSEVEVLLLPLRHRGKTHSLLLGSLSLAEPPGWIGLVPAERLRLVSMRVIEPAHAPAARETPLPLMRRPASPTSSAPRRRGHLTVYTGGRSSRF